MAFTMHSHSGEFCPGHAKDSLEAIIQHAIVLGYKTMALTEHMPRTSLSDLYPEELTPDPQTSLAALMPRHLSFLAEALRLRSVYASKIHILIGFEGEWIRDGFAELVTSLAADARVDFFIGSLHHTCGIPIDFDRDMYASARDAAGGTERELWGRYYDEQVGMLRSLKPRVVGHFDLIRLLSENPERNVREWEEVWEKVVRNLEIVKEYGGWLECNTSALRKELGEPYPARGIAEEWVKMGGKFTFSDDSHGIAQVATNYVRGLNYLEGLGVKEVWTLERPTHPGDGKTKSELVEKSVSLEEFRESLRLD